MSCEHDDAAPLCKGFLHTFHMVNLNIVSEVFLIEHRHGKDIENVARHVDE